MEFCGHRFACVFVVLPVATYEPILRILHKFPNENYAVTCFLLWQQPINHHRQTCDSWSRDILCT